MEEPMLARLGTVRESQLDSIVSLGSLPVQGL